MPVSRSFPPRRSFLTSAVHSFPTHIRFLFTTQSQAIEHTFIYVFTYTTNTKLPTHINAPRTVFTIMYTLALTTLLALSAAAPHAHMHAKFHAARVLDVIEPRHIEPRMIEARQLDQSLSDGTCGGSSGKTCPAGFCCSQWGFCGQGPAYCGTKAAWIAPQYGAPASSAAAVSAAAPAYSSPAESAAAPVNSAPPPESSAAASAAPAATTSALASAVPAPSASAAAQSGSGTSTGGFGDVYKMYSGSGNPSSGWPTMDDWMSFEDMFSANKPTIMTSCTEFSEQNNSEQETADLKSAILSTGTSNGVDPRFILAVVMQESKGCVRVYTTNNGVVNPGLMQSHDGSGSCNSGGPGGPGLVPCPQSQILQMIQDGTLGTSQGDGLKQIMATCTGTDQAQIYYQTAAVYNSGNLPANLDDNTATPCYSADIANRLTGWTTAQSLCTL